MFRPTLIGLRTVRDPRWTTPFPPRCATPDRPPSRILRFHTTTTTPIAAGDGGGATRRAAAVGRLDPAASSFIATVTATTTTSTSTAPPSTPTPTPTTTTTSSSSSSYPKRKRPARHPLRAIPAAPGTPPHDSLRRLLPLLSAQQAHYITVHFHARPYLLTVGDVVRLPFHMPDVVPGDILRLNRASVVGSRDYTLKGAPYLDERLFECRARVLGIESEPMHFEKKTRRRRRKVKTVKSKHRYTVLRLAELRIKTLEEAALGGEEGMLVAGTTAVEAECE
ncbi:MAG: hypothetical protein M1826_006856 [Phylliscum demangeonii]|nr:MAG: hypothetical protein M1826_006856 [Phylliscum demangeonii]